METPFKCWLFMTIGVVLYQSIRAILGLDFRIENILDASYWVGVSMILVHVGVVGNG